MANSTEILKWDSDFFSLKIASICVDLCDELYIKDKLSFYKALDFDLVYVFLREDALLSSSILSSYNCQLVDCKIKYGLAIEEENHTHSDQIVEFDGDATELYDLGIQAGITSRYKIDSNFKEGEFERLYTAWIDNSVNHKLADKVMVYKDAENIVGFITLKKKTDEMAIILIAIDPKFRRLGIGGKLLSHAKKYARKEKCKKLTVATQKHNEKACLFYERFGMNIEQKTYIYHVWLQNIISKS
jgi:Acetyltransferases